MTTEQKRDDGGPAFPVSPLNSGMTLRDYFAAAALTGASASGVIYGTEAQAATDFYRMADAMLEQRRKP